MKKLLVIFFIILCSSSYSQLYKRAWGTLLHTRGRGISYDPKLKQWDSIYFPDIEIVGEVNLKNNLFYRNHGYGQIYKFNTNSVLSAPFYTMPITPGGSIIQNFKLNSKGDMIICGRILGAGLATPNAYSTVPIPSLFTGSGFVAKIDVSGKLVWFTYFHPIVQNASSLTIDKNDNIYLLTNRENTEVLPSSPFQSAGDLTSSKVYLNAISKLDTNGKHIWSTFYGEGDSKISSIVAGTNGVYFYGDHLGSTSSSSYFGTKGSFQENATGMTTGGTNNASTVFLSRFNLNGTRAWSTYLGVDRSLIVHNYLLLHSNALEVINDDAYILTKHEIRPGNLNSITSQNSYIKNSVATNQYDITLSKFYTNGTRAWTTFLHGGEVIKTNNNELFISSRITSPLNITTTNSYQKNYGGGTNDIYINIISDDGKSLKYGTYYGFQGSENAVAFPTSNGFYAVGYSKNNNSKDATLTFATNHSNAKKDFGYDVNMGYVGNFLSYFTTSTVSTELLDVYKISIFPNPTTDILNIQSKEELPENTSLTIYDISGKQVLNKLAENSNLNQINVSQLNSGIYILQIDGSNLNYSFKFIKN